MIVVVRIGPSAIPSAYVSVVVLVKVEVQTALLVVLLSFMAVGIEVEVMGDIVLERPVAVTGAEVLVGQYEAPIGHPFADPCSGVKQV